ncbi:unnamed protein product [Amoebophrya sp. A120]|nr:unnamed protein product [Amoebophrya sp. A120]|eukprot:GSA120T00004039001.1
MSATGDGESAAGVEEPATQPGAVTEPQQPRRPSLARIARSQTQQELFTAESTNNALLEQMNTKNPAVYHLNTGDDEPLDVDLDLSFDVFQFAKTFLYESLPTYVNLLAIVPVERFIEKKSFPEIYNFCWSRIYIFTISNDAAFPFATQVLLVTAPNTLLIVAICLWAFDVDNVRAVLDLSEILTWIVAVLMRNCVVAIKYGFLEKQEILDQYGGNYNAAHRVPRKIFLGGWATPNEFDKKIMLEEMQTAMALCDCDLNLAPLRVKPDAGAREIGKCLQKMLHQENGKELQQGAEVYSSQVHDFHDGPKPNAEDEAATNSNKDKPSADGGKRHSNGEHAYATKLTPPVTALDFLYLVTTQTIASPLPGHRRAFMLLGIVAVFIPPVIRSFGPGDLPAFGDTAASKLAVACCVFSPGFYVALMAGFAQVAIWTYQRRARAFEMLDRLCAEGVGISELVPAGVLASVSEGKKSGDPYAALSELSPSTQQNKSTNTSSTTQQLRTQKTKALVSVHKKNNDVTSESPAMRVVFDLADSETVVSLLLLRRCLRKIGSRYNSRMDGFSMAFFGTGIIFVGTLCLFFLTPASVIASSDSVTGASKEITPMNHRMATDILLLSITIYISVTLAMLLLVAAKCNEAPRFKMALQRAALTSCAELVDEAEASAREVEATRGKSAATWQRLLAHKELLQMADTQVGYEEEVVDPVRVLGVPASFVTVGATISAIFTGLFIALQGWLTQSGAGWSYSNVDGVWRPPSDT